MDDPSPNSLAHQLQQFKFKNTNVVTVVRPLPDWVTKHDSPLGGNRDVTEYYDSPTNVRAKVKQLAELIKESKHVVVFTGAGISTSASIPDYRGPDGLWTRLEKGGESNVALKDLDQAKPTLGHCAITALVEKNFVQFVVSTNLDGLHLRSGLPEKKLAELHGNAYKESCDKCHKHYHRAFDCTKSGTRSDHWTGRNCECGGKLLDNIINFGENLPENELDTATKNAEKADLSFTLGTSMLVVPACLLPGYAKKMVICNLQKTPYDDKACLVIHAKTDTVLKLLLEELKVELPKINPQNQTIDDLTTNWEFEHHNKQNI